MTKVRVVESNARTTKPGGVIGRGFLPGRSGNPGGRPRGLARRVQELVGDSGEAIAAFMYDVMSDERARTTDRLDAARWLADRGFGRAVLAVDVGSTQEAWSDFIKRLSTEDLQTILAILDRYPEPAADSVDATASLNPG